MIGSKLLTRTHRPRSRQRPRRAVAVLVALAVVATGLAVTQTAAAPRAGASTLTNTSSPATTVDTVQWGASGDIPVPGDYNGDGWAEVAVFRPSVGYWYVHGGPEVQWGASGDIPVPGDYNGDGRTEIAVFRPSVGYWYVHGEPEVQWGASGDIPVPGDYNGDGRTEIAVFRPSVGYWYVHGEPEVQWGASGDIPVPGDYNGDGQTEIAVYRPGGASTWHVRGVGEFHFGTTDDIPVPGDYNADRRTDLAVFRPGGVGMWYVNGVGEFSFGTTGDTPVFGDYDGEGTTNIAVFRPSTSTWYLIKRPSQFLLEERMASAMSNGRMSLFARGTDNQIWQSEQAGPGSSEWSDWYSIGAGYLTAPPAAARNANGGIEVFSIGGDNQVYRSARETASSDAWSGWTSIGAGALKGEPSAVMDLYGRVHVFGLGFDDQPYYNAQVSYASTTWTGWIPLDGRLVAPPVAVRDDYNRLLLFGIGGGNELYVNVQTPGSVPGSAPWSGWIFLGGGPITGQISAVRTGNFVEVFARRTDNGFYRLRQAAVGSNSFQPWQPLGGILASDPIAVGGGYNDRTSVFGYINGHIWTRQANCEMACDSFSDWTFIGSASGSSGLVRQVAAARSAPESLQVFGLAGNGRVARSTQAAPNSLSWGAFEQKPGMQLKDSCKKDDHTQQAIAPNGRDLAKMISHVEWCWTLPPGPGQFGKVTRTDKYTGTTLIPQDIFTKIKFENGDGKGFVNAQGMGQFTVTAKVTWGLSGSLFGKDLSFGISCYMTIDGRFTWGTTTTNGMPQYGLDTGGCLSEAVSMNGVVSEEPTPELPFPPVHTASVSFVWDEVREETDIAVTFGSPCGPGTSEMCGSDIIDSPMPPPEGNEEFYVEYLYDFLA